MSSSPLCRRRAAFVAGVVVLGGCAEVEGLGRFSAVEAESDQPPALEATGTGSTSGGSQEDAPAGPPPDADVKPAEGGTDAGRVDGGSDASLPPDVSAPPPSTNYAIGATVDATPSSPMTPSTYLNDGNLSTSWSPGPVCTGGFGGAATYDCSQQTVSVSISLLPGHTVGRIVVRAPAGVGTTGIVTGSLTVLSNAGLLPFTERLDFPAKGDATFTFTPVAGALEVTIQILTASTAAPTIGEIEIYGS